MVSFVYLGVGELNGVKVFKIGKTIHPKYRHVALRIKFTSYIACLDEIEALALEALLLTKARTIGAKNLPGKYEWFRYNDRLYKKILSWFDNEADELIAQVTYKVQAKRDQLAKRAASAPPIERTSTTQQKNSNDAFRDKPSPPNPITLEEMQTVIDSKRAQIAQLEHTIQVLNKRRDGYIQTIQMLQEQVNGLRRDSRDIAGHVREEMYQEHEKYIQQLHEKHEREIKALLKHIGELRRQIG